MLFSLIKKCVFAFLVFFICLPPIILSQNISETTRLVVTFESAEANAKIKPINVTQRLPCRVIKQYGRRLVLDMQRIVMDLEAEKRKIQSLFDAIELVELDYLISTQASPWINPESQTPLWNLLDSELHSVHAEGIWNTTHGNPNEVVAVIDSGIAEVAKPMFLHLLDGYDFVSDARISMDGDGRDADATDPGDQSQTCPISSWHGTKVASVIAGRHDNPWGMKGIAQNCSILPLRVLGQCRMGYATDVSDALVWAIGGPIHGIPSNPKRSKTITLSLAGRGRCPNYLQSAVDYALRLGAAVIAAAGNYNESFSEYFPGNCEGVIAVAASTREGELASYSNWGTRLQAPGGDLHNAIMSLGVNPWGTAVEVSFEFGTSFAAPHVSSMVVLGNSLQNYSYMSENDSYVDVVFDRNATSDFSSNISSNLSVFDSVYAQSLPTFTNNRPGFQVYTNHNNLRFAYGSINFDQIALQEGGFYFICDRGHFICDITLEVQKERKLDGTGYWPFRNLEKYHVYCCNMKFDTTKFGDKTHARLFANAHLDSRATETLYYKKIFLRGFQFGVDSIYLTTHQSGDIEISRYWWWEPWRPNNYWADDSKCDKHGPEYIVVGFHGIIGENFFHSSRVICAELFVPVPIGFYSNGPVADANGGAIACPKGTFSSAIGSAGCTSCSSGFYASNTGSSRCIACTTCHTGSYPKNCGLQSAGACTVCSAGSFSPASTTTCTRCSAGTFSSASSVSCSNCLAGKFSAASASVCSDCEGGKFSAAQSSSSCDVCPANMFSLASSTACTLCHPGTASSSGVSVCSACPNTPPANARFTRLCEWRCNVGYYNATPSACTLCTSNVSCAAGLFRAQCTDGIQNSPGNCTSVCTTLPSNAVFVSYNELNRETGCWWGCNRGFYRSSVLTTATCISSTITCSHGFYPTSASYNGITHTTTAPSCAACAPTIPNADFSGAGNPNVENSCPYTCKHGFFKLTESGACNGWTQQCTAGYFWTAGTKTSDATCTECSPNYAASANPEHYVYDFMTCSYKCSAGYGINAAMSRQCIQCAPGKYQNPQASTSNFECKVCDSNSFQNSPGSAECIAIPVNGRQNGDGSDYICNSGYFKVPGRPGALIGSCSSCATCASGNYWSVACEGTAVGTCSSCTSLGCSDTFYRSGCSGYNLGSCTQCATCPSGSFFGSCTGNALSDDRSCGPCPVGKAGGGGYSKTCTDCVAGSFASAEGTAVCSACSAGQFSTGAGAIQCTHCVSGKYSTAIGATSDCPSCPEGVFCSSSTTTATCGDGTFCPAGASQATACLAGTFRACTPAIVHFRCVTTCVHDLGISNRAPWNQANFIDPQARWIWNIAGAATNAPTSPDFSLSKRVFVTPCHKCLASGSVQVRIHVMADDYCTVFINSVQVGTVANGGCTWCTAAQFSASLVAGYNTIRFLAGNSGGAAGIAFAMYCTQQDTLASILIARSDNTWCLGASCTHAESAGVFVPTGNYTGDHASSRVVIGATCVSCSAGTVSAAGASQCSACNPGFFAAAAGSSVCVACNSIPVQGRFTSQCDWVCNHGFFKEFSTTCASCSSNMSCNAGFFRAPCTNGISDSPCTFACPAAPLPSNAAFVSYNNLNTNSETFCWWGCNRGFYRSSALTTATCISSTITCSHGFYPTSASYNGITHTTTAPSCAACAPTIPNADFSGAGNPNVENSCPYTCKHGFFKLTESGACNGWTQQCTAGYFWTAGTKTSDATCTECSPNYAASANPEHYVYDFMTCSYKCSAGYGINAAMSRQCIQCAPGKYQNPQASTSNFECKVCDSNSFQNSPGSAECIAVPANGQKNDDGSDYICNKGYFRVDGIAGASIGSCSLCATCASGNYWSVACNGTTAGTCSSCSLIGCPDTFYRSRCSGYNLGSCIQCSNCTSGSFFGSCNGNSLADDRTCSPCPMGQAGGGGFAKACTACGEGSFSSAQGATACAACSSISPTCSDTFFRSGCGGSSPGTCTRCRDCNSGSFFGSCSGSSLLDDRTCTLCPAGQAGGGGFAKTCTACGAGSYSSAAGAHECFSCSSIGCPDTYYRSGCGGSLLGSCLQCSTCSSGSFFGSCSGTSLSDDRTCTACPAGKAGAGTFSKACTDCIAGTFSPGSGAALCTTCSPGKFSAAAAAVACADCSPIPALGQFTNLCAWKCHLGHFKDSVSSCSLCSSNTSCNAGLFKAACIDGISDTNCSLPCSTKSQQASSQYTLFFVGSTDTYCWWGCNRGFYKNVASAQCVSSSTVCNAGFYPSSPTFNSFTTLTTAPSCEPCFPSIQHANFSGGGNPNNASSCPYRCNHGYFNLHPWGSCSLWTSNCPAGFFWTGGTATADATCTECSPNHVRASSTDRSFYVYSPNVCTFKCIPGYGKRAELNDQCRACPAGMYHNSSVLNSICQLCGAMEYQKSVGMDQCVAVPPFGQAIANRSDFTCNHGYVYQAPSVLSIIETCALCQNNNVVLKGATSQIKDIVWRSGGQCVVESFSCNEGFYRNWTQHDCMACPSEAPANALKLSSTSGICPLCNGVTHAAERDRNAYCPFQCNSGFYSSPSFNYSCIRCSVPVCSLGLFSQLCVLNQTVDQCQTCSHVLQASQNWVVSGTTCQWHCRAGFFLNMSARPLCQMCAPGRIKPLEGNHSCSDCPVGSFSASSISCQFCNPGRYSNATASTVCQQCEMGTFSPSVNRTSCISCVSLRTYPSSRTLVTGSSLCVLCPALFPLSQDGVMCGLPLAPCPTGFYLPQLALNNTLCALCPVGTYCDDAQGTLIPKPCPFGRPFSFLPSVSIDNCSSTNFLTDERWRTTC